MTSFTINSRNQGLQTFTVSNDGGYVRLNGKQICEGGRTAGGTVSISNPSNLETVARKWWAAYLRNLRAY